QLAPRRAVENRNDDRHGRDEPAGARDAPADRGRHPDRHPAVAFERRHAQGHQHLGDHRDGGRRHHDAGDLPVREARRLAGRPGHRPVPRDRRAPQGVRAAQGVRHQSAPRHVRGGHRGPLMSPVLMVFVLGAGAVLGIYFAITKLPGYMAQRKLEERIGEVTSLIDRDGPKDGETLVKGRHEGPLPALDRLVAGSARGSSVANWVDQTGVKISVSALLLLSLGCSLVLGFIAAAALRMAAGWLLGGALGFALPWVFLRIKRTKRMRAFEESFPEALDLMARALKAGHAFVTGLKMVADEMPEPIGPE